uniref:Peptidase A2 domain-containing protein n=1 Tax=Panagrolaimus davidi TaxID=227884 RepID=A0A914P1Q7_9BILA
MPGTPPTTSANAAAAPAFDPNDLVAALQAFATSGQSLPQQSTPTIPRFVYDPANSHCVALWFDRIAAKFRLYKLSDEDKVAYAIDALDADVYAQVARELLPDKLSDLKDFGKLEQTMVGLFDRQESLFVKRYSLFQMEWKGPEHESINAMVAHVREATLAAIDPVTKSLPLAEVQTLVLLMAMKHPALEVFRTQVLNLLKKDPATSLSTCQTTMNNTFETQREQKLVMETSVNYVQKIGSGHEKKLSKEGRGRRLSSPCASCGGQHDRNTCRFRHAKCNYCDVVGHIEKVCRYKKNCEGLSDSDDTPSSPRKQRKRPTSFNNRDQQSSDIRVGAVYLQPPASRPTILSIQSRADDHRRSFYSFCGPITLRVAVKNTQISAQFDTGAGISVISLRDYKKLGKPFCTGQPFTAGAAGKARLPILGSFVRRVTFNGSMKHVRLHVADVRTSILGRNFMRIFDLDQPIRDLIQPSSATSNASSAAKENIVPVCAKCGHESPLLRPQVTPTFGQDLDMERKYDQPHREDFVMANLNLMVPEVHQVSAASVSSTSNSGQIATTSTHDPDFSPTVAESLSRTSPSAVAVGIQHHAAVASISLQPVHRNARDRSQTNCLRPNSKMKSYI